MKKTLSLLTLLLLFMATAWADEVPAPVYFNDFSSQDGLTVVGNGVFEDDADARFGKVFHNDPTLTKAIRTNYLLLPADVLSHSKDTKEMTIGFWVNMKDAADFYWSPLFAAYDRVERASNVDEPWPHLALFARKEAALNCWGYCDLGNTFNDKGTNAQTSAWLDDKAWHYYTATLTATSVKVYIDGNLENSWTFDGVTGGQIVEGVFNAGAEYATNEYGLKYICLGGNQACNWADPDPAFAFDDFAVYNKALSADQIKQVIDNKLNADAVVEAADIAAFNAAEDGKTVKLTLTNARVNGFNDLSGTYYVEDASGATAIKGIGLIKGSALNGYIVGKKGTEDVDFVNTPSQGLEYSLTVEDATLSAFEATPTELVGTAMTIAEAAQQANYGRLVTLNNVTIEAVGNGKNKQLTDAEGNTIRCRDLFGVLSADYEWPAKASKLTGVVLYYMTGWFIIPISEEAIEAAKEVASLQGKLVIGKVFYAGSIRLNDAKPKNYMKHLYIELYNNSDETIDVAGTYIALANSDSNTAAWTAADMVDDKADCAVVKQIFQIPATSPALMEPGKSLVITNCAVDHSEIAEGNVNLSDADYEVKSQNNAFNDHNDNVPELLIVKSFGTTDFINFLNPGPDGIVLLPADTDIASCPETYGKGKESGNLYTVVPMANSIDCVDIVKQKTPSAADKRFLDIYDAGYTCTVDPGTFNCQAVARKVESIDGDRKVLKDTNNSSEDFEVLSDVTPRTYGEGVITGITTVRSMSETGDVRIYNLQGVRLNQLQRGLNIVNGKKVIR